MQHESVCRRELTVRTLAVIEEFEFGKNVVATVQPNI